MIYGFVEHLEWEDPTPPITQGGVVDVDMEEGEGTREERPEDIRRQLKEEIVRLLIVCVQSPSPSISRLLLGYMQPPFEKKKLKEVPLQDPGNGAFRAAIVLLLHVQYTCAAV